MAHPKWIRPVVILMIVSGALLPMGLYHSTIGAAPTIAPLDAIRLLSGPGPSALLVDVRDTSQFEERHLQAAENWPLEQIRRISTHEQVPSRLQGKTLLLICNAGLSSAEATRRLDALGLDVHNVRGGIQEWVATWEEPCTTRLCTFETATGQAGDLAFRTAPLYEQWLQVSAGFVIKPIYMALSGVLVLILVRRRRRAPDLLALRWALAFFLAGETACVIHSMGYLFLHERSHFFEYLHGYGMVLAFGFTVYALVEGMDARVIRLSSPGKQCAALGLCGSCVKYEDVPCKARRLFLLVSLAVLILAAIPLPVALSSNSYNTYVLGTFYNYSHPVVQQLFEFRLLPILAMILASAAFIILWRRSDWPIPPITRILLSAAAGGLGFSVLRLLFTTIYGDSLVWFDLWEELTELLFVVGTGLVLWIFRERLFQHTPRKRFSEQ